MSSEQSGFFPFTVQAIDQGGGRTWVRIDTYDPAVGFGFGGTEIDPVEVSEGWTIIGEGDDGRRYLFLQNFAPEDAEAYLCEGNMSDRISGDIVGIVSEVWDAARIGSRGVQCCLM